MNLYFAETDAASEGTGLRVFGVNFQGTPVIENLDIYGTVGANAASGEECGGKRDEWDADD